MRSFDFRKSRSYVLMVCLFFFSLCGGAHASKDFLDFKLPDSVQIHGFLSQGFIHTSDNNLFGHSDDGVSTDFRELGLNGSWRIMPELQLSLQMVWRDAGQTDEDGLRVDYGIIDYSFYSSESSLLGVKVGRVPTPLGFYIDTRDVASTRPSILLPQSIYFDRNRNIALSADGGYIYAEKRSNYGDFLFTAGAFNPRTNDPSLKYAVVGNDSGKIEGDTSWIARLSYEWQSGRGRLAITYGNLHADYEPNIQAALSAGSINFRPIIFSAQYNAENWTLTSEYALRTTELEGFGVRPNDKVIGESFYIQGTYKVMPFLEGLIRYDQLSVDKNDKDGRNFTLKSSEPSYSRFAKDWTFGVRVIFTSSFLVSAEYHRVNGTAWLSGLETSSPKQQYWDLYMMMISYSF